MPILRPKTPVEPGEIVVNTVLCNDWKVKRLLGKGGFGKVYHVIHTTTGKEAAFKIEDKSKIQLRAEVDILSRLKGKKFVIDLIQSGKKTRYNYIIMSLLGPSVQDLIYYEENKEPHQIPCSASTTLRFGIQALHGIKQLHDVGLIHRDIKPANFAFGHRAGGTDPQVVHLFDFGLSRDFITKEGDKTILRKPRREVTFKGTNLYASISALDGNEQSRADDLLSLMYAMVEMRSGELPWKSLEHKNDDELAIKRKEKKKELLKAPAELFPAKSFPSIILKIWTYLCSLDYWSRPDYLFVYRVLLAAMDDVGAKFSDPWDWEKPGFNPKMPRNWEEAQMPKDNTDNSSNKGKAVMGRKVNPFTEDDFSFDPWGF